MISFAPHRCGPIGIAALFISVLNLLPGAALAQESRFHVYRAIEGDTLIKLGNRFLIRKNDWQVIQKNNSIANPNRIPVGTVIRIPVAAMRTEPSPAVITATRGRVASSARTAIPGMVVAEGDTLRTGDDGFVTIKLADGSTLTVQSKSAVRIETARQFVNTGGVSDTVVRLDAGRVETRAAAQKGPAARYEIRTPTSNMGVRGTIFRVAADDTGKKGQSEVIEGMVGVASTTAAAPALALPAGFGSIVEANKPPSQPVALLPAPDLAALTKLSSKAAVTFTFPAVPGAVAYRAQVSIDAAFTSLVADMTTATPVAVFAGLPDGDLFLRARGIDSLGLEGKDGVHAFRVKARPFPPALLLPAAQAQLRDGAVRFTWQAAADTATASTAGTGVATYRVQIADDAGFTSPLADKALPLPGYTIDKPLASGRYFWRVASVTAKGEAGPWSDAITFEVRANGPQLKPRKGARNIILELENLPNQQFQVQVARDEQFIHVVSDRVVAGQEVDLGGLSLNVYYVRIRAVTGNASGGAPAPASAWSDTGRLEVYPNDWWLSTFHVPAK